MLTLKDYEPHELKNLLDELDEKGDASVETKRIEKLELQIERSAIKLESQMKTFEKTYEQILYASDFEEDENDIGEKLANDTETKEIWYHTN